MTNQGAVRRHSNAANVAARVASKYAIVPGSVPSPIKIARSRTMRPSIMLQTVNVASDIKSAASFGKISTKKTEWHIGGSSPSANEVAMSQKKIRSRHLASQEPHNDLRSPSQLSSPSRLGQETLLPTAYWPTPNAGSGHRVGEEAYRLLRLRSNQQSQAEGSMSASQTINGRLTIFPENTAIEKQSGAELWARPINFKRYDAWLNRRMLSFQHSLK